MAAKPVFFSRKSPGSGAAAGVTVDLGVDLSVTEFGIFSAYPWSRGGRDLMVGEAGRMTWKK